GGSRWTARCGGSGLRGSIPVAPCRSRSEARRRDQEEPALPATGGARMRGASKGEPALPATGGARMRGASNDCQRCGACCCNPAENRAEGYRDYVLVEPGSRLLRRRRILDRYTVLNAGGERHLKLVGAEQRCAALEGALGRRVR